MGVHFRLYTGSLEKMKKFFFLLSLFLKKHGQEWGPTIFFARAQLHNQRLFLRRNKCSAPFTPWYITLLRREKSALPPVKNAWMALGRQLEGSPLLDGAWKALGRFLDGCKMGKFLFTGRVSPWSRANAPAIARRVRPAAGVTPVCSLTPRFVFYERCTAPSPKNTHFWYFR